MPRAREVPRRIPNCLTGVTAEKSVGEKPTMRVMPVIANGAADDRMAWRKASEVLPSSRQGIRIWNVKSEHMPREVLATSAAPRFTRPSTNPRAPKIPTIGSKLGTSPQSAMEMSRMAKISSTKTISNVVNTDSSRPTVR